MGDVGLSNIPSETINPGVAPEDDDWYDGIDQDCGGNNDFDQDGDGYLPAGYEDDYIAFVELHYGASTPPWGNILVGVDCLDQDDSALSHTADLIYPGATDTPYNGIDENCAGDNDFDLDLDRYRAEGYETEYLDYTTKWVYTIIPATNGGDCDDGVASTYPGALEVIADGSVDSDCDGFADTATMNSSTGWDTPSRPVAMGTDDDYILTATALGVEDSSSVDHNTGYDFRFDKTISPYTSSESGSGFWLGPEDETPVAFGHTGLSLADRYYAGGAYSRYDATADRTTTWLLLSRNVRNTAGAYDEERESHAEFHDDEYVSMDVATDGGERLWMFACGSQTIHFITVIDDASGFKREKYKKESSNILSNPHCFLSPPSLDTTVAQGTVCSESGCTTYDIDRENSTIIEAAVSPWAGEHFVTTSTRDDWLIAALEDGGVHLEDLSDGTKFTILDSHTVVSADAVTIDGTTYVLFVSEDNAGDRSLILAYGELGSDSQTWIEAEFSLGVNSLVPEHTSIYGDTDRLFLAASASGPGTNGDALVWTFLAPK
jgi:hypothetical protein